MKRQRGFTSILTTFAGLVLASGLISGQSRVEPPENKYSLADDVKLGREAAAEAREQLPIMRDERVTSYVQELGRHLVTAVRPDLRHEGFKYTFEVVNVSDLNAFALPGGPMFVNRGMLEAARNEGEVAGVMAHEISHVVLRHGTAQASRATPYQVGELAGAVIGALIGGRVGNIVAQGTSFGLGAAFLRYGREYERQADLEGARLLARAGYDPRDMANMFRTIEKNNGSGGPEWLSSHPNPGNRYEAISQEASTLRVVDARRNARAFERVRTRLRELPPAPTTEQATRNKRR
jgi:predicted Zn-dependent protease